MPRAETRDASGKAAKASALCFSEVAAYSDVHLSTAACNAPTLSKSMVSGGTVKIQIVLVAEHLALAGRGQDDEFVGQIAADRSGLGHHRYRLQAHARESTQIGDEHLVVGMARAVLVEIEGIGILHQEFAPAHQPEARPHLVAEFPLDVIEIKRKIAIRPDIAPEDVRNHLLVGRTIEHFTFMTVLDPQHLLAVGVVTPALAPQISRLDRGHEQLNRA